MNSYKIQILEKNGIELEYPEELELEARNIPISGLNVLSDNVEDALIEVRDTPKFKPRNYVNDLTIPSDHILILHEPCFEADLILDGDLIVI